MGFVSLISTGVKSGMICRPILYGNVKDMIAQGLSDDVFPPQDFSLEISSADFYWGDGTKLSPEATINFRGHHGSYYLTYYWEIKTITRH